MNLIRRVLSFAAFAAIASCATDSTAPGTLTKQSTVASDIEVPVDAGALVVTAMYMGAPYSTYGTDGCPFTVRAQRGTSTVNSGPCVIQGPFQFNNLPPGSWDAHLDWGMSMSAIETASGISIVAGQITNTAMDVSADVGIVHGTIQVNGVAPQSATLCVRAPLDQNGSPLMSAGSVCRGFSSMPGMPADGKFRFFVRTGAARLELTGFGGVPIGQVPIAVNAGETHDLGVINFQLGELRVTPRYNGLQHPFGTDGCPLSVTARSATASITSGPCSTPVSTFVLSNLAAGSYSVGLMWGMMGDPIMTQQASVLPPNATDLTIDVSNRFGIVKGALLVNGQPPSNVLLCVRSPLDGNGFPTMNAGQICKFYQSMPGMPAVPEFALLVPAGPARLEIANGSLGMRSLNVIAGETIDLGTIATGVGSMRIAPTFNGQPYASYNTDECPFMYSLSGPTNAFSGPCFSQNPFVFTNLQPGNYSVAVRFAGAFNASLVTRPAVVAGGVETPVDIDMTDYVAIITGTVLVNGAPPVDVTVCVTSGASANDPFTNNGRICKWFRPPMAGMPPTGDTRFRFFIPKGCFTGEVTGTGGVRLGSFNGCVDAGDDVDLGNPLDPPPPPANSAPTITSLGGPYAGSEGSAVQFTGSATDPDGNPLTYEWSFGDGTSGVGASVSHIYKDNGNYSVTLTVRDPAGLSASASGMATIANAIPHAVLHAPPNAAEGASFTIAMTAPFDPGQADQAAGFTFALDCGSGFGSFAASPLATCAGSNDGPRVVRGRIRDKDGGVFEHSATVNVANVLPSVTIVAPVTSLLAGETFSATGSFTDPGPDAWTASVAYEGTPAPLALSGKTFSLSHRFMTAGNFTVNVTINDGSGNAAAGVAVRVMSLAEALTDIAAETRANVGTNEQRPLLASLEAAIASLDRGNIIAARNQLEAYLSKLETFVGSGKVSAAMGATLEAKVRKMLAAI